MNGKILLRKTKLAIILLTITLFPLLLTNQMQAQPQSISQVKIQPEFLEKKVGETVNINVTVNNISGLYGWEFKLYYSNKILNATHIAFGPFLESEGSDTYSKIVNFTDNYNATYGRIWAWDVLLRAPSGVSGNGTLASITFKIMGIGISPITLNSVKLSDIHSKPINHTTTNGYLKSSVSNLKTLTHKINISNIGTFTVKTQSNFSVSPFPINFNAQKKEFNFNLTGNKKTTVYFKIVIPTKLMWGPWIIKLNGTKITSNVYIHNNNTYTTISFLNIFHKSHVEIVGAGALSPPESSTPPWIYVIIGIITFITIIVIIKLLNKQRKK